MSKCGLTWAIYDTDGEIYYMLSKIFDIFPVFLYPANVVLVKFTNIFTTTSIVKLVFC